MSRDSAKKDRNQAELPRVTREELGALARKIAEKVSADPAKAARLVTQWVDTPRGARKPAPGSPARVKKSA
jgi:hypothetical protein